MQLSSELLASPGYFGPPTSSVDWCETNYAWSYYVSEMWNTLSSLVLVVLGVLGVLWHHRHLERHFVLAYACLSLVGVGSTAFHGTLRFELQMLDELPMLYLATLLVYLLVEDGRTPRFGRWLPSALAVYLIVASYGAAFTRGAVQFWSFQVSFAALEFFALFRTYRIYRNSDDAGQRRLFRFGMTAYLSGIVLWFFDLEYCAQLVSFFAQRGLAYPQLHAWWHVLVGFGTYSLLLVIAHQRLSVLGKTPVLRRRGVCWLLRGEDASVIGT